MFRHSSRFISGLAIVVCAIGELSAAPNPRQPALIRLGFVDAQTQATGQPCARGRGSLQTITVAGVDRVAHWTTPVPVWLSAQAIDCAVTLVVSDWHYPAERDNIYQTLRLSIVETSDTLALAGAGGVVAFALKDGRLQFNWQPSRRGTGLYFFDTGTFEIYRNRKLICRGSAPLARVFAACEQRLFFFDADSAAVLTTSGQVIAETAWDQRYRDRRATVTRNKARIPLGPYTLVLQGITFL